VRFGDVVSNHPAEMCGECGCIHRPGENTLCPGWRPGPFVPSPQPEMPVVGLHESSMVAKRGQLSVYPLTAIRELLATQGLAIVPAAEVTTPGERKVLEACAAFPDEVLNRAEPIPSRLRGAVYEASEQWREAMIAWREEKPRG
jgi:hypothetical protein